jgi:hypothetical protein
MLLQQSAQQHRRLAGATTAKLDHAGRWSERRGEK